MSQPLSRITSTISSQCIARKLRSTSRVVSALYDDAMRPYGVRMTQVTLLVAISRWGGEASPTDLAGTLHIEKSTLSRNLVRLEERGWIRRAVSGRQVFLHLTAEGEEKIREIYPVWKEAQRRLRAWLDGEQIEALEGIFKRLPEGASASSP